MMRTVPYGYCMKDGQIAIKDDEACALKTLFENYLSGMGLMASARSAGIPFTHSVIRRLLENPCYAGSEFYPALISEEWLKKAHEIRLARAKNLGKDKLRHKRRPVFYVKTRFYMDEIDNGKRSPLEQAVYVYQQIREVEDE